MQIPDIDLSQYTYALPDARIAKYPLAERDKSKLLIYKNGLIKQRLFAEITAEVAADSLMVFNNTKVVQARLLFEKTIGAKPIEIFCLDPNDADITQAMAAHGMVLYHCLVGNAKRWTDGLKLTKNLVFEKETITLKVEKVKQEGDTFLILFTWPGTATFAQILELAGQVPLPPYLHRQPEKEDVANYQTVYAKHDGSVAAPTAGLHFTPKVFQDLQAKGIQKLETTLHVGAGTFKPITADVLADHTMHYEEVHISQQFLKTVLAATGDIVAVGTTSARTLESAYWIGVKIFTTPHITMRELRLGQWDAYELPQDITTEIAISAFLKFLDKHGTSHLFTQTQLLIAPGYKFRIIDALVTNFHQPGSTLILLVAAVVGKNWQNIYDYALQNDFRFLSFGDSSLLYIDAVNKIARG